MIVYVRRPRADYGARHAEGEGRLTIIFVVVTDNDVVCPRGAGVVGPDVTERGRGRAGAIFALEVVGFVISLSHVLGFDPDRAAGADCARALAGAGFRDAPVGEQDGLVAQLRDAVQAAVNAPLAPVEVITVSPRVDRAAVPGNQRGAVAQPLYGELDVSGVRALILHESFDPHVAEKREVGLRLDASARLTGRWRPDDLQGVRTAGAGSDRDEGGARVISRLRLDLEDVCEVRRSLEARRQLELPAVIRRLPVGMLQDVLIRVAGSGLDLHALAVEVRASVVVQVAVTVKGEHVFAERAVKYFADVPHGMAAIRRLEAEAPRFEKLVRVAGPVGRDRDLSARIYWTQGGAHKAHYAERQRPAKANVSFHRFPSL